MINYINITINCILCKNTQIILSRKNREREVYKECNFGSFVVHSCLRALLIALINVIKKKKKRQTVESKMRRPARCDGGSSKRAFKMFHYKKATACEVRKREQKYSASSILKSN